MTVYIPEADKTKLFKDAKLAKKQNGKVRVYKKFWKKPENKDGYVHPVLAYVDLIATGDVRNRETAQMIFEKYIARYIQEN